MSFLRSAVLALSLLFALATHAAADQFGLTGGEAEQNAPSSIGDLFKGGGGTAPEAPTTPDTSPPDSGWTPFTEPGPTTGIATPSTGGKTVKLAYDGHAVADGRRARIELSIAPNGQVTGTITIQSICEPNIHLGGADLTFAGQLTGTWESKAASIDGTWKGTEHFCGSDMPNNGQFKFFRKEEAAAKPVLHLRITGQRGRYGWDFPPTDRVYLTPDGSAPPVADAGDGTTSGTKPPSTTADGPATGEDGTPGGDDGKDGKDGKPQTAGGPEDKDSDPDKVTGVVMLPSEIFAAPGGAVPPPTVYAIIGDAADRIAIPDDQIAWELARGLEREDGQFTVSSRARDGDKLPFKATVKLSMAKRFEQSGVLKVTEARLGSISGKVFLSMAYPRVRGGSQALKSAVVELRPDRRGTPVRTVTTGPDGTYRFDGLVQGRYVPVVTSFKHRDFEEGYKLKQAQGPWIGYGAWIPNHKDWFKPDPETATWDHKNIDVEIELYGPDYQGPPKAVTGRVIYKGKGVSGVTVMANRSGSEGGGTSVISGADGVYRLPIRDLPPGDYWLRAEKYVVARWAGPDDFLDVATNRDQKPLLFPVPFAGVDEMSFDIEVLTRHEIFGGVRGPEQPEGPP